MDSISSFALRRTGPIPYCSRSVRGIGPGCRFFRRRESQRLPVETAARTFRILFKVAALKPEKGRVGPRPYDLRHAFAVHRLSQWYRQGVDLHSRLPWLSTYMGHVDIVGTETYLNTTPEILDLVGKRLRRRYTKTSAESESV
jgi:integrase/recombinase XerD